MGLNTCTYCNAPLELVSGTNPDNKGPNGEWQETYECANGHTGRYEYVDATAQESFYGACK